MFIPEKYINTFLWFSFLSPPRCLGLSDSLRHRNSIWPNCHLSYHSYRKAPTSIQYCRDSNRHWKLFTNAIRSGSGSVVVTQMAQSRSFSTNQPTARLLFESITVRMLSHGCISVYLHTSQTSIVVVLVTAWLLNSIIIYSHRHRHLNSHDTASHPKPYSEDWSFRYAFDFVYLTSRGGEGTLPYRTRHCSFEVHLF